MPGSTSGSKLRNLLSLLAAVLTAGLLAEAVFVSATGHIVFDAGLPSRIAAVYLAGLTLVVFGFIVVGAVWLHNEHRPIAPGRLIRDTCVSASFIIAGFAFLYRYIGIAEDDTAAPHLACHPWAGACLCDAGPMDTLYFSIVTFSTLGFGDYTACSARVVTGVQALLGNLHLGLFVGGVFYYLSESSGDGRRHSSDDE